MSHLENLDSILPLEQTSAHKCCSEIYQVTYGVNL